MGLNDTPSNNRMKIGILGKTNAGKSSLINALTHQDISIVSEIKGTTTDAVKKSMELFPLGPVLFIDTPGIDDDTKLANERKKVTDKIIESLDIAIFVKDGLEYDLSDEEINLIKKLDNLKIPVFYIKTKCDLVEDIDEVLDSILVDLEDVLGENEDGSDWYPVALNIKHEDSVNELLKLLGKVKPDLKNDKPKILEGIVKYGELVVLVTPIDESAPKGRLILPQQLVIRSLLDIGAHTIIIKPSELEDVIRMYGEIISLVITDSQAFNIVGKLVPKNIRLTSFSILLSFYKGDLSWQLEGIKELDKLNDGDKILISEACTHHIQCNDIGRVKIPKLIEKYTGKKLVYEFTSGNDFELSDLTSEKIKLIIHCGGCMISDKEMKSRISASKNAEIPITNYGMVIAKVNGILDRAVEVFENE